MSYLCSVPMTRSSSGNGRPATLQERFDNHDDLLAFSLRLGTELTYCQPQNKAMSKPVFLETDPFLVWEWKKAELDWAYPWADDCTIYRTDFAKNMLRLMDGRRWLRTPWKRKFNWAHPTSLEGVGAGLVRHTLFAQLPELMASYTQARVNVVTVNRVQNVSSNPVYGTGVSAEELLRRWKEGVMLDVERYTNTSYDRIHIGDLFLTCGKAFQRFLTRDTHKTNPRTP